MNAIAHKLAEIEEKYCDEQGHLRNFVPEFITGHFDRCVVLTMSPEERYREHSDAIVGTLMVRYEAATKQWHELIESIEILLKTRPRVDKDAALDEDSIRIAPENVQLARRFVADLRGIRGLCDNFGLTKREITERDARRREDARRRIGGSGDNSQHSR